jgi:hypothetical protein
MRHLVNIAGIIVIALVIYFGFLIFLEGQLVLYEKVVPPANVTLEDWLESFKWWGTAGIIASWASANLWYLLGQWVYRVNTWQAANYRPLWYVNLFVPVIVVILGILFTAQAQEGAIFAYIFYGVNWLLTYYFATALFSPSSFKYAPLGAKALRRW